MTTNPRAACELRRSLIRFQNPCTRTLVCSAKQTLSCDCGTPHLCYPLFVTNQKLHHAQHWNVGTPFIAPSQNSCLQQNFAQIIVISENHSAGSHSKKTGNLQIHIPQNHSCFLHHGIKLRLTNKEHLELIQDVVSCLQIHQESVQVVL